MDSLITAAARALGAGDPLGALKRVALRGDPPALALRGIAMAQLGDFARARELLREAARKFGAAEAVARARCIVAEAEVALASRDLGHDAADLDDARATLEANGDMTNAAHARYLAIRRLVLIGRVGEAEQKLAAVGTGSVSAAARTTHDLMLAEIAMRRVRAEPARAALARARESARSARIPALQAEVGKATRLLDAPAARVITVSGERLLRLDEVEELLASKALVVDASRNAVRDRDRVVSLATRPVLFALVRALAEAWPNDLGRDELVARAFRLKLANESHRARLRVELTRLRAALRGVATIGATARGFAITPVRARDIAVLLQPFDEPNADVLALLADGESWSSSALALALGISQRTVQRALDSLSERGRVHAFGHGRARRWSTPPLLGFTTALLLPVVQDDWLG